MSFQAPLFLTGLLVVPLALAALILARRRPAKYVIRFPAAATLAPLIKRGSRVRRNVPPALLMLALAAMAIALARPEATVAVPVEKASVVLVTDTSGSMNATDVAPNRIDAAKAAAARFLKKVPEQLQVGLVSYADGPQTVLRPTQDRAQVQSTLDSLKADGGTATGDALNSALAALGDQKPAAIVLLSDGASKSGADPAEVARRPAPPTSRSTPSPSAPPTASSKPAVSCCPCPRIRRRCDRSPSSPAARRSPPRTPMRSTRSTRRSARASAPRRRSGRSAPASPRSAS